MAKYGFREVKAPVRAPDFRHTKMKKCEALSPESDVKFFLFTFFSFFGYQRRTDEQTRNDKSMINAHNGTAMSYLARK